MGTKTKVKSKTTKKKSTTKKPVSQKKSPKKMTSRPFDQRSITTKYNKFLKNLWSGVNLILEQHEDLQKYVLWNMFWGCIYTTHSNSFISKHIEQVNQDSLTNDEFKGELFDYQLCPMNKKRLENGMENLIDTGGVAKFQKVLDDLDKSLIRGRY